MHSTTTAPVTFFIAVHKEYLWNLWKLELTSYWIQYSVFLASDKELRQISKKKQIVCFLLKIASQTERARNEKLRNVEIISGIFDISGISVLRSQRS